MYNYGTEIKAHREHLGISQLELSKKTGISHQNINRWESGKALPNIAFCVKLADFFDISLDELIGRENRSCFRYGGFVGV